MTYTSTLTVEERHLACNIGSGELPVLGTPMMMALMENAAMMAAKEILQEGESTVGGFISSSHIKPTGLGQTITATAKLINQDGNKLTFKVYAAEKNGAIGEGEHVRFIIDEIKFMKKVEQ